MCATVEAVVEARRSVQRVRYSGDDPAIGWSDKPKRYALTSKLE
jgi:hypothetical protein